MTSRGSLQNSDSSVRPKKLLTERGIMSCINRTNTHLKRRSEWQIGIILQAKEPIIFQWFCFSVERYEIHHQLQDTIPQHSGESTTDRRSECVLLHVWKNTIHTSWNLYLLHTCTEDKRRWHVSGLQNDLQAQKKWQQPAWKPVLTIWPPSSHRSSTDHWSCAKSPMLQMLHHHPCSK